MTDTRGHFHRELAQLEAAILGVAARIEEMIAGAVKAVADSDLEVAEWVIAADDEVDRIYLETHNRWVNLMARQGPMGGDLRVMSALLHMNVTLERSGDQCVNIAKMVREVATLPHEQRIIDQIREMGDRVRPMLQVAIEAYVRRDGDLARTLPAMDEPVDELNRNMYREVVSCGPNEQLLEWATRMMMVARALERIGDQAVDIGEQVSYVATGEFREFEDG